MVDSSQSVHQRTQVNSATSRLAWQPDIAANFGDQIGSLEFEPIIPKKHKNFLTAGQEGELVVSGARGMGKTTLVAFRAARLNRRSGFTSTRNTSPFGYFLRPQSVSMTEKAIVHFQSPELWEAVWRVVIAIDFCGAIISKGQKVSANDSLEKWLEEFQAESKDTLLLKLIPHLKEMRFNPHSEKISDLVTEIVSERPSIGLLKKVYDKKLFPILNRFAPSGDDHLYTFIDGFDEALASHDGEGVLIDSSDAEVNQDANMRAYVRQLWVNAQAGLGLAAISIRSQFNARFLPLVSIRSEALPTFIDKCGRTETKIDKLHFEIKYSESDLIKIFCYNVYLMADDEKCSNAKFWSTNLRANKKVLHDACDAFCGYRTLRNRVVMGPIESVYSIIRRHGFDTPRNIVTLGGAVAEVEIEEHEVDGEVRLFRDPQKVLTELNSTTKVLDEFLTTRHPPWDERYEKGFKLLPSNLLFTDDVKRVDAAFEILKLGTSAPFTQYLYQCGLLGQPDHKEENRTIQSFHYENRAVQVSAHDYYMVHPAFSARIRREIEDINIKRNFYDGRLLISANEECPGTLSDIEIRLVQLSSNSNAKVIAVNYTTGKSYIEIEPYRSSMVMFCLVCLTIKLFDKNQVSYEELVKASGLMMTLGWLPDVMDKDQFRTRILRSFGEMNGETRAKPITQINQFSKDQAYKVSLKSNRASLIRKDTKEQLSPYQIATPTIHNSTYLLWEKQDS